MNYFLKYDPQILQAEAFMQILNNSLREVGRGVAREFIHVSRTERGYTFAYGIREVEFFQRPDDSDYRLKLTRGTKGSIESHYNNDEHVDAVNVLLNWLIHQEYSSDNHIELTERLEREARKYD